jgi:hypothetical protein
MKSGWLSGEEFLALGLVSISGMNQVFDFNDIIGLILAQGRMRSVPPGWGSGVLPAKRWNSFIV